MARENRDLRIALFIDFENLVTRTNVTSETFDLQQPLDKLLERGKVVFRRAYADWSRFMPARQGLHDKGVELIDVPPSTRAGKNAADIRLVIDALELAYQREHVDAFCIASGDSDFCPLAYKLREIGRTVIGLGVKEATSPLFVKACDEFLYLGGPKAKRVRAEKPAAEMAREEPPAEQPKAATPAAEPKQRPKGKQKEKAKEKQKEKEKQKVKEAPVAMPVPVIPVFARDAAVSLLENASEPLNQSLLMNAIVRREPDFDVKVHGFSTFSKLIEAMEREGLLKRKQGDKGQWYIVPA